MAVKKAVIPVAGLGTRLLPATKIIPKEMLPIVDKPALQYVVEEAVAAGVDEIIFVTSRYKASIEDHFDDLFPELEMVLRQEGAWQDVEEMRRIQRMAKYMVVRQAEPLGLGHAILCAKNLVGEEPFVVMLPDNETAPETPCLPDMIKAHERYDGSVLSLVSVSPSMIPSYGIVSVEDIDLDVLKIIDIVEKPALEDAPSNLGVYGRYVLTPDIFAILEKTPAGKNGEIQITDAIEKQVKAGGCYGVHFKGDWYDTGTPLGLLTTSIAYALKRSDIAPALREYMSKKLDIEE
jgi:UTP--glucose-1-phosphate uridylyltransferase